MHTSHLTGKRSGALHGIHIPHVFRLCLPSAARVDKGPQVGQRRLQRISRAVWCRCRTRLRLTAELQRWAPIPCPTGSFLWAVKRKEDAVNWMDSELFRLSQVKTSCCIAGLAAVIGKLESFINNGKSSSSFSTSL